MRNSSYQWLVVGVIWPIVMVRTTLSTTTSKSGKVQARGFRAGFLVWSNKSLSLSYVAQICALLSVWEGKAYRASPRPWSGYFGVSWFLRTWVPAAKKMWLAGPLLSTIPHLRYLFYLRSERRDSVYVRDVFCCNWEACSRCRKTWVTENIVGTSAANKDEKPDKK